MTGTTKPCKACGGETKITALKAVTHGFRAADIHVDR